MILAILLLHLVLGPGIVAAGDRLGRRGFTLAALAPAATLAWLVTRLGGVLEGRPATQTVEWVPELGLTLGLRLDALGAVMVVLVSGIGLLVCLYSLRYFAPAGAGTARLAGLMTLFAGAMLGVVLTDHLLALFVFWELTSVTSYLLIGNDDRSPQARQAALQAIIVTGAGGLALLAGLVLIGQVAGTYRLSELAGALPSDPGPALSAAIVLILVGAFTKSAQLPFAGWLPGAMVAPTPISAYLHAATMVKAGVYLVARLAPVLAGLGPWRPLLLAVASATMVVGGWRALRQHDLKLLLAYGTVSQLGFLMLLFGMGADDLAQAGVVLLLAHGAFKAALFLVVGVVDHQAGTRDVRRLGRLGPGWGMVRTTAVLAAASMAGFPPLVGFIAKEKGLDAALHAELGGSRVLVATIVAGSVLTVAYSGRFVLGLLGRLAEPDANGAAAAGGVVAPPPVAFSAPATVLAGLSLVAGLAPIVIDDLVRAATSALHPDAAPKPVQLWAGVNAALGLSVAVFAAGLMLVVGHRPVERLQRRLHRLVAAVPDADRSFQVLVDGLSTTATRVTRIVQNGSLPVYLMVILAVAAIGPLLPAVGLLADRPELVGPWEHVPFAALVILAAAGTIVVRRRIAAALLLGAVGFVMSGFYVLQGAPDLALTQFTIETLATVLFVLVLRFLPKGFADSRAAITAPLRLVVSIVVGLGVFVLALVAGDARSGVTAAPASDELLRRSVPEGKGANVVNVILVDFRGLDTLGEITVLVVAALGVVALARTARRSGVGPGTDRPFARLPIVDTSCRLLYPSILVLSAYLLFAGHNQPGGGFVGGLTAGAAISLRYVAGGVSSVRASVPARPWTVIGSGLLLAVGTALVPLLAGRSVLEHAAVEWSLPVLGALKTTSALPFDIGVYLVVVGLVLMAYEAFGDDVEPEREAEPVAAGAGVAR